MDWNEGPAFSAGLFNVGGGGRVMPGARVLVEIVIRTGVIYLLVLVGIELTGEEEMRQ